MKLNHLVAAALALSLLSPASFAVSATGSFIANKACSAYVSKNNKTNPDHAETEAGQSYEIIEANVAANPSWYRLTMPSLSPAERWVAANCGKVEGAAQPTGDTKPAPAPTPTPSAQCHTPNHIDSYVFAVSWQPAFCETHQTKPECQNPPQDSYQARNFTLHGLWPNQDACGINYDFCSDVVQQKNFCSYKPVPMSAETEKALGVVMPSVAAGSCLDRHEWYKHGTCQTDPADQYFDTAMALLKQFNDSGLAAYMSQNVGQSVELSEFIQRIDTDLGAGAHERMQLGCDKLGNLVDIYINLPKEIAANSVLKDLIGQAKTGYSTKCGAMIHIDKI